MKTIARQIAQVGLYDNIDKTMELYAEMIHEDAKNHKYNKTGVEALETLIRAWATLQTVTNACEVAETIRTLKFPDNADDEPQPLELPFDFSERKSKVSTL